MTNTVLAPEPEPIVSAVIAGTAPYHYTVRFVRPDGGPLSDHEYLLFTVHYYARVLYELARAGGVRNLPRVVDRVITADLPLAGRVFALAGVRGGLGAGGLEPEGRAKVALHRTGPRHYEVDGEITLRGRMLAFSFLAVLECAFSKVGRDTSDRIIAALANMNVSYGVTHHYRDPRSRHEVPALACMAAAFV